MKEIAVDRRQICNYIREKMSDFSKYPVEVVNTEYHHCTLYGDGLSIVMNGILTLSELNRLGVKKYSNDQLKRLSIVDSHVNGIDGISLAVMGLKDLYDNEEEYCPYCNNRLDFLIDSRVHAHRIATNYGNEYISYENIENSMIKAIDIRLLCYIKEKENNIEKLTNDEYIKIIEKYNHIRSIANAIVKQKLDIIMRENSDFKNTNLDLEKIVDSPRLVLRNAEYALK